MSFHQQHSQPIMDELARWMKEPFDKRLAEPNSGLGKALRCLLRHCEQSLKRAILHRKASMFYKTVTRAEIGDIYNMSRLP